MVATKVWSGQWGSLVLQASNCIFCRSKRSYDVFIEMVMRIQADETYEQWAERVQQYEYDIALTKIAKGVSVDEAMEWMSKNIAQKMLHPVFAKLRNIPVDTESLAASKKHYEDTFINRVPKAADHVDD